MIRRQFMNVRREICCERGIPKGMIILSFILTEYLMRIWIFIAMLGSTIKKIHWREHNWAINDFFDFFLIRLGFEGNLILNWCGLWVFSDVWNWKSQITTDPVDLVERTTSWRQVS